MKSRKRSFRIGWLVLGLVLATAEAAAELGLELPLACRPAADCWVVNYVDLDPGPGVRDYACGRASYDGHKGVDFAVRDFSLVTQGVPVRAVAAGVVLRARDGMADAGGTGSPADSDIAGRECGNGLVIDHGRGWTTQYCHLRRGSIAVKPGDRVAVGDAIGMVGQSGLAEFPHVHIQVAKDGQIVDPFRGVEPGGATCGLGVRPLWSGGALTALEPYRPSAIYNGGIADVAPDAAATRRGLHREATLSAAAPALVAWADIYWVEPGDRIRVRLFGPAGETLTDNTTTVEKTQARRFVYAGLRRKIAAWPAGVYRSEVVLLRERDGRTIEEARFAHALEVR
jgi:murein DD-endopeptidase MepM/ murein hydrolase activator NlpD